MFVCACVGEAGLRHKVTAKVTTTMATVTPTVLLRRRGGGWRMRERGGGGGGRDRVTTNYEFILRHCTRYCFDEGGALSVKSERRRSLLATELLESRALALALGRHPLFYVTFLAAFAIVRLLRQLFLRTARFHRRTALGVFDLCGKMRKEHKSLTKMETA
eukprot:SAG11_NODE_307_length_10982_cov_22.068823_4_plen_161_part_00